MYFYTRVKNLSLLSQKYDSIWDHLTKGGRSSAKKSNDIFENGDHLDAGRRGEVFCFPPLFIFEIGGKMVVSGRILMGKNADFLGLCFLFCFFEKCGFFMVGIWSYFGGKKNERCLRVIFCFPLWTKKNTGGGSGRVR